MDRVKIWLDGNVFDDFSKGLKVSTLYVLQTFRVES
jgi:hypothetical protein